MKRFFELCSRGEQNLYASINGILFIHEEKKHFEGVYIFVFPKLYELYNYIYIVIYQLL